jgi:hypothetical protein
MMKKIVFLLMALCIGLNMSAQNDEIELFQSVFKLEKKALLVKFLSLSDAESEDFWSTYNEYEAKLSKTSNKRIQLIKKYAESYENMTDEQANALVGESFAIRMEREKLQKSYYNKLKKSHGAKRGAQFVQFERFVQNQIDNELNQSFPLIGEY